MKLAKDLFSISTGEYVRKVLNAMKNNDYNELKFNSDMLANFLQDTAPIEN
ncbi:hypothetical protein QJR52_06685 [Clostridium baratii]|uniref:hypothetical protein n=1 Tax=Clostridium baratii TaxID=1561 RepID=UPI0030CB0921